MSILSDNLCTALKNVQSELDTDHILEKLKKIVERHIQVLKKTKKIELVLDDASSRIKSVRSFKEKLARKNYLKDWGLNDYSSLEDCQKAIRKNLSDLIGIRVNCFFKDDEEPIYKYFIEKLEKLDQISKNYPNAGISLFLLPTGYMDDVKKLKTGDFLYKVSCEYRYKNSANSSQSCFIELQIKCMTHNLWGEVEHEISYKAKQYDYAFQSKNKQIQDIYSSLKASDSQLRTLYTSQEYQAQDLLNSLFFLYTQNDVRSDLNEKNPTQLYTWFFQIFKKDGTLVVDYVKNYLVPSSPFSKAPIVINNEDPILRYFVKDVILSKFFGKFNDLSAIANRLYENVNENNIIWLIGSEILKQVQEENTEASEDSIDPNVLRSMGDLDNGLSDFLPSDPPPPYEPTNYLKIQPQINETIEKQSDTFLSREDKNVLLRCVETLCYVISGGVPA